MSGYQLFKATRKARSIGAEIISYAQISERGAVAFCKLEDNQYTPYVTWFYNAMDDAFHYGHYHTNESDAWNDYIKRLSER